MLPVDLMDALLFIQKKNGIRFCAKLLSLPSNKKEVRKAIRFTISSACECEFDKLGRINIPTNLRTLAHLEKRMCHYWGRKPW